MTTLPKEIIREIYLFLPIKYLTISKENTIMWNLLLKRDFNEINIDPYQIYKDKYLIVVDILSKIMNVSFRQRREYGSLESPFNGICVLRICDQTISKDKYNQTNFYRVRDIYILKI